MVPHWTSVARSCLISLFRSLTSHIPSFALSSNNWILNRATASASHGGASPIRRLVVDDSISGVVDVSLPTTEGAIRTFARSTRSAGSSQIRTFNSSQPNPVHPIVVLFQRQELGKALLGLAVPTATGLFLNQYQGLTHLQASAIAVTLSIGIIVTWIGMLLHGICPRAAAALECFGAVTILVAFFGLLSFFLPPSLVWACWLCGGLSFLPFLLCLVPWTAVEEERSAERLGEDIV